MRKIFICAVITAIFIVAACAFYESDRNSKELADFLNTNVMFEYKDGKLTILNEKISLR
jgi:hypothetical protein